MDAYCLARRNMVENVHDTGSGNPSGSSSKNKIFKELMDDSFEKIKSKLSSKKHKELQTLCDKAKGK